jgi:hypothetical protein
LCGDDEGEEDEERETRHGPRKLAHSPRKKSAGVVTHEVPLSAAILQPHLRKPHQRAGFSA